MAARIADAVPAEAADRVVEIGPGRGALTGPLLERGFRVLAIELDRELAAGLRERWDAEDSLELVEADALEVMLPPAAAGEPLWVVGNLPYAITSPLLFHVLDQVGQAGIAGMVFMIQREVADRVAARPGTRDYGVLSILVQLHASVERVLSLPPGAFRPPPRVHSAVVRLTFGPPAVTIRDQAMFDALVRSVFMQRRKQLANALAPFAASHGLDAGRVLAGAGLDAARRPETLQLAELARLADVFVSG